MELPVVVLVTVAGVTLTEVVCLASLPLIMRADNNVNLSSVFIKTVDNCGGKDTIERS